MLILAKEFYEGELKEELVRLGLRRTEKSSTIFLQAIFSEKYPLLMESLEQHPL